MQLNNATYQYDANGNMTHDGRRGLDLSWNHLNLPSTISNVEDEDATVNYTYLADGTKVLAHASGTSEGYAYLGTMVYKLNNGGWTLETTPFTGGRFVRNATGNLVEQRHITDHLGSTRTIVEGDDYTEVEQNDYYPFGKRIADNTLPTTATNRWRFSGKEIQTLGGINLIDFGLRLYDDHIVRWPTQDALSEKYHAVSMYSYCANNPISFIDPDGKEIRVSKEYQERLQQDLSSVFGEKSADFSFDENGVLKLDIEYKEFKKGLTRSQKQAFKGLYGAMIDTTTTNVVYAEQYPLTIGGELKQIDIVKEYGGGLYSREDNTIVVAPSVATIEVIIDPFRINDSGNGMTRTVQQNTTTTLFHEIGERNSKNKRFRGAVIDYENHVRAILKLPERPYDVNHSYTIPTH